MGQVNVTLNGRTYRLSCGDGEEQRLLKLVAHVRGHVDKLVNEHGQIGDERLLLMASLLITDELIELRAAVGEPETPSEIPVAKNPRQTTAARLPLPRTAGATDLATGIQAASTAPASSIASGAGDVARAAGPTTSASAVASAAPSPVQPASAVAAQPARSLEFLDATALMKGLEKKVSRT